MSWRADISRNVRQFRIFFDGNNKGSIGLRSFVENNYTELKALNPTTPFLVRQREGAPTQLWASFGERDEVRELDHASEEQVERAMKDLVLRGAAFNTKTRPEIEQGEPATHEQAAADAWNLPHYGDRV